VTRAEARPDNGCGGAGGAIWWVARRCGNGEGGGANTELGVEGGRVVR
jgi:hypothetical protein